jgi:hypothetical protein
MAACTLSVGVGEWAAPEAGLVAATVCAVILANARVIGARDVRIFKEQISTVLVGALFILLASRLDVTRLLDIGPREVVFIAGVLLLARPIGVAVGTVRSALTIRERVFAAFMAPRGIVAASMASVTAATLIELAAGADPGLARDAPRLEELAYQVIVVTVAISGTLAWPAARLLGVLRGAPSGVLIVGAHELGRQFARELQQAGIDVRLVDANGLRVAAAQTEGIPAVRGDATDLRWVEDQVVTPEIGWVVAWTGNDDVDKVVRRWGAERFGAARALLWAPHADAEPGAPVLGDGRPLSKMLEQVQRGERRVSSWPRARDGARALVVVANGRLALAAGAQARQPADALFIGLE